MNSIRKNSPQTVHTLIGHHDSVSFANFDDRMILGLATVLSEGKDTALNRGWLEFNGMLLCIFYDLFSIDFVKLWKVLQQGSMMALPWNVLRYQLSIVSHKEYIDKDTNTLATPSPLPPNPEPEQKWK